MIRCAVVCAHVLRACFNNRTNHPSAAHTKTTMKDALGIDAAVHDVALGLCILQFPVLLVGLVSDFKGLKGFVAVM